MVTGRFPNGSVSCTIGLDSYLVSRDGGLKETHDEIWLFRVNAAQSFAILSKGGDVALW